MAKNTLLKNSKNVGIVFPLTEKEKRSTQEFHLKLIHHVLEMPGKSSDFLKENHKSYRLKYDKFFLQMMADSLKSREKAFDIATKGLNFLKNHLRFIRENGESVSLEKEISENKNEILNTKEIKNKENLNENDKKFSIEYKGKVLKDRQLYFQLEKWRENGIMEIDAEKALLSLTQSGKINELDKYCFILIGAGSAMGPFNTLMELGATVICLEIPRENVWKKLINKAKNTNGTIIYPENKETKIPGCDLLRNPAEILNWLKSLEILKNKKVVLGNYTYLDGALHVLLSAACDAIISELSEHLNGNLSIAFLCTPTDPTPVPKEAFYASRENYNRFSLGKVVDLAIHALSFGSQLKKNDIKFYNDHYIYNGLVVQQGPNYALAKISQLWRSVIHFIKYEHGKVSLNVAPASATQSVLHRTTFKWAYAGMPYFNPIMIFDPKTSSALMTGLLLHDVMTETPNSKDKNPVVIKSQQSIHGGVWRCAYSYNTLGIPSIAVHMLGGPEMFVQTVFLILITPFVFSLVFRNWKY